jgi:hypothetical protein
MTALLQILSSPKWRFSLDSLFSLHPLFFVDQLQPLHFFPFRDVDTVASGCVSPKRPKLLVSRWVQEDKIVRDRNQGSGPSTTNHKKEYVRIQLSSKYPVPIFVWVSVSTYSGPGEVACFEWVNMNALFCTPWTVLAMTLWLLLRSTQVPWVIEIILYLYVDGFTCSGQA